MANPTSTADEPAPPAGPLVVSRKRVNPRFIADRLARRVVTLGGGVIIASILAIFVVIAAEVLPLAKRPTTAIVSTNKLEVDGPVFGLAVDEYREVAALVTDCAVTFVATKDGSVIQSVPLELESSVRIVALSPLGRGSFAIALSDGRVLTAELRFDVTFTEAKRTIEPDVKFALADAIQFGDASQPARKLVHVVTPGGPITVATIDKAEIEIVAVRVTKSLIDGGKKKETRQRLAIATDGETATLALDGRGEDLFIGTSIGKVIRVDVREPAEPKAAMPVLATSHPRTAVTTLGFLNGDRTLVVGDADGGVSSWQMLVADGEHVLTKIYDFSPYAASIRAMAASERDKSFLTADAAGTIRLCYGTTGATLLDVEAPRGVVALVFAPKADDADTFELVEPRFAGIVSLASPASQSLRAGQTGIVWLRPQHESIASHLYHSAARWVRGKLHSKPRGA